MRHRLSDRCSITDITHESWRHAGIVVPPVHVVEYKRIMPISNAPIDYIAADKTIPARYQNLQR